MLSSRQWIPVVATKTQPWMLAVYGTNGPDEGPVVHRSVHATEDEAKAHFKTLSFSPDDAWPHVVDCVYNAFKG